MKINKNLLKIYNILYQHYGPQRWWPGESPFEVMVGAILTQNTNWSNAQKAMDNLKNHGLLDAYGIKKCPLKKLALIIRPSGFYHQKAARLKSFVKCYIADFQAISATAERQPIASLRARLLALRGIGPETADSMLLYAMNRPVFVIDAYTKRIFSRLGFLPEQESYDRWQQLFMKGLPKQVKLYNEYHALIVRLAKEHCRTKPLCRQCPLNGLKPADGGLPNHDGPPVPPHKKQ